MQGPLAPASTILTFQGFQSDTTHPEFIACRGVGGEGDEGADGQASKARRSQPQLSPTVPLPRKGCSDLFPLPLNA